MATFTTDRLQLRRLNSNDFENMLELESDPEVIRHGPLRFPISADRIKERLQNFIAKESEFAPFGMWAAELKDTNDFVGWFMILNRNLKFPELGFMIVRRHWRQGYTTEACQRLVEYAFKDLKCAGLSAVTDEGNYPSINVLTKVGFQFVKSYQEFDKVLDKEITLNLYELIP